MVCNLEVIFLRKPLLCLMKQFDFLINEIRIVYHLPAPGTYKVVMVMGLIWTLSQFISGSSIANVKSENEGKIGKDIQCSIHRSQANVRVYRVEFHVDVLCAHMLVSPRKDIQDRFPCDSHPVSASSELPVPPVRFPASASFHLFSLLLMIIIFNYKLIIYRVKVYIENNMIIILASLFC